MKGPWLNHRIEIYNYSSHPAILRNPIFSPIPFPEVIPIVPRSKFQRKQAHNRVAIPTKLAKWQQIEQRSFHEFTGLSYPQHTASSIAYGWRAICFQFELNLMLRDDGLSTEYSMECYRVCQNDKFTKSPCHPVMAFESVIIW